MLEIFFKPIKETNRNNDSEEFTCRGDDRARQRRELCYRFEDEILKCFRFSQLILHFANFS